MFRITSFPQFPQVRAIFTFGVALSLAANPVAHASEPALAMPQDPLVGDGGTSEFYVWQGMISGRSGTMLRTEDVPAAIMLKDASRGMRILYTSTSARDRRTAVYVSGDVFFPKGAMPEGGWPIIAWNHGTTGIGDRAAPSWTGRTPRDAEYLNTWLQQGYAIVASDYQGLGTPGIHAHLNARLEAYSTLDAIRAARSVFPELSDRIVLVGQSQGAHGAFSTALFAPSYAPELAIRGVVATGIPNTSYLMHDKDWLASMTREFKQPRPVFAGPLLFGASIKYWDPKFDIRSLLTDHAAPMGDLIYTEDFWGLTRKVMEMQLTYDNTFKADFPASAERDADVQYPRPFRVRVPVFIGTGLDDEMSPANFQYAVASAACSAGSKVEVHYYPGLDHGGTILGSLVDSVPFVRTVFAGKAVRGNCKTLERPATSRGSMAQ